MGLSNPREYFAELSEAYFGRNDFYPFVRSDLCAYDKEGFAVVDRLWRLTGEEIGAVGFPARGNDAPGVPGGGGDHQAVCVCEGQGVGSRRSASQQSRDKGDRDAPALGHRGACQRTAERGENRRVAIRRLRLALAIRVRCEVPIGDARSELWRSRCSAEGRVACNTEHHDYPAPLAEAPDMVHACGLDVKKAAARLLCSASQLIKLIQQHPAAIEDLNRSGPKPGEHPLH